MNTATTMKLSQNEVIKMLEDAGLVDGEKATEQQKRSSSVVLFWDTVLKSKIASDKQTYVVWTLVSTERKNHADDKVRAREAFAAYDIYTRRTKTSRQVQDLISSLDEQASENGWQFEYNGPAEYERDTAIYHIAFNLYKIFK
ncbi:MAG: hypothetical protein WC125_12860 [Bacteroidales bacterium]